MCNKINYSFRSTENNLIRFLLSGILVVLSISSTNTIAVDEEYLKALEVEAENSAKIGNGDEVKPNNKPIIDSTISREKLLKFEAILEFNKPTTFRFYKKLKSKDKQAVFSAYKKDQSLKKIRKVVLDYYFEQNQ